MQKPLTQTRSRRYAVTNYLIRITAKTNPAPTLIDLNHLRRQTMDDNALQSEVLGLFHQQLLAAKRTIASMDDDNRRDLAHLLAGAASAVGAFSLAKTMEALSHDPANRLISDRALSQINALLIHLRDHLRHGETPDG